MSRGNGGYGAQRAAESQTLRVPYHMYGLPTHGTDMQHVDCAHVGRVLMVTLAESIPSSPHQHWGLTSLCPGVEALTTYRR
jgi:hypothetical protein